jgi:hypothetical protein
VEASGIEPDLGQIEITKEHRSGTDSMNGWRCDPGRLCLPQTPRGQRCCYGVYLSSLVPRFTNAQRVAMTLQSFRDPAGLLDDIGYCFRVDSLVRDTHGACVLVSQRSPFGSALGTPQNACQRLARVRKRFALLELDGKQPFFRACFSQPKSAALAIVEHVRSSSCHPEFLECSSPMLSANGDVLVFDSNASDLVPGSAFGRSDVYWVAWKKLPEH